MCLKLFSYVNCFWNSSCNPKSILLNSRSNQYNFDVELRKKNHQELEFSKLELHAVKKFTQMELKFSKLEFQAGKFFFFYKWNSSLLHLSSRVVYILQFFIFPKSHNNVSLSLSLSLPLSDTHTQSIMSSSIPHLPQSLIFLCLLSPSSLLMPLLLVSFICSTIVSSLASCSTDNDLLMAVTSSGTPLENTATSIFFTVLICEICQGFVANMFWVLNNFFGFFEEFL